MKRFELNPIKCICMLPIDEEVKMHIIQAFTELLTVQKKALDILSSMDERANEKEVDSSEVSADSDPISVLPSELQRLPDILRKPAVIDVLKISESTYYRHIRNGLLTPRKLGKQNYFRRADLLNALKYSKIHGYL